MTERTLAQLIDLEQIRCLLEAQYKLTEICSWIQDPNQNILVAVGWQEICTRFHRIHPGTCARRLESNKYFASRPHELEGGYQECRCKNGLWDVALPIILDGRHLATFITGQFFYDDDEVDEQFFRAQAAEFGFDESDYLAALRRVPVFTREQVRNVMDFYRNLANIMVETGLKKLQLAREAEDRKRRKKAEPERRNRLFMGRELRMVEPKENIREPEMKFGGKRDEDVRQ
jgi:hypothetical protein